MNISEKEQIIYTTISYLEFLREDLKTCTDRSPLEGLLPVYISGLQSLINDNKIKHRLIDAFKGIKSWDDLGHLEEPLPDVII